MVPQTQELAYDFRRQPLVTDAEHEEFLSVGFETFEPFSDEPLLRTAVALSVRDIDALFLALFPERYHSRDRIILPGVGYSVQCDDGSVDLVCTGYLQVDSSDSEGETFVRCALQYSGVESLTLNNVMLNAVINGEEFRQFDGEDDAWRTFPLPTLEDPVEAFSRATSSSVESQRQFFAEYLTGFSETLTEWENDLLAALDGELEDYGFVPNGALKGISPDELREHGTLMLGSLVSRFLPGVSADGYLELERYFVRSVGVESIILIPFEASFGKHSETLAEDSDAFLRGQILLYQFRDECPVFRVCYGEPLLFGSRREARLVYEINPPEGEDEDLSREETVSKQV